MNSLSFQGIAGSITQLSKDEVSHLGSRQPPIAVGCRDIGVTNARGTLACLSCTSSPEILCLQNAWEGSGERETGGNTPRKKSIQGLVASRKHVVQLTVLLSGHSFMPKATDTALDPTDQI